MTMGRDEAENLLRRGTELLERQRFEEALTPLAEAAAALAELGIADEAGGAAMNLGSALHYLERPAQARLAFEGAVALLTALRPSLTHAMALVNLAVLLADTLDFEALATTMDEVRATLTELGDKQALIDAHRAVGDALANHGRAKAACDQYFAANDLYRSLHDGRDSSELLTRVSRAALIPPQP